MKKTPYYIILLSSFMFLVNTKVSFAQNENDKNIPGKIYYQEVSDPSWSKLFKVQSSVGRENYYAPMEKYVAEACNVISDVPAVKPPKGFNVKPYVSGVYRPGFHPNRPVYYMNVTFCNYSLFTDKSTQKVKQSGIWSSSIRVFINDPSWLLETDDDIEDNCDSLGIPYFYYRPRMHKDKNGYWVIQPYKVLTEIRVIKKKDVPLYKPLTQRDYLNYRLALAKRSLVSDKEMLSNSKKRLRILKYPQNKSWIEQDIKDENQGIEDDVKAIRNYQQALSTWPNGRLNDAAYISIYYRPKRDENQIDLVAADYKGATELVRLNKAYFDKKLPKGTPQLIMVGAQDDPRFGAPDIAQKVHYHPITNVLLPRRAKQITFVFNNIK